MPELTDVEPLHDHPAKFSEAVLFAIAEAYVHYVSRPRWVIDPFAGVGGIHELRDHPRIPVEMRPTLTFAIELEPEWAAASALLGPTRVADSSQAAAYKDDNGWPLRWHAVITSVCYGNRFADRYRGQNDTCRACAGTGFAAGPGPFVPCTNCNGSGRARTRRYGYANSLNRDPTEGSAASMQWGPAYREFHQPLPSLWHSVTAEGAVLMLNISDHVRGGQDQGVHLWWASIIAESGGWHFERAVPIDTPRSRNGANRLVRASCEWLLIYTRR